MERRHFFERFDWVFVAAVVLILIFGLVVIFSLDQGSDFIFFKKQLIAVVLGLIVFFVVNAMPSRLWYYWSYWLYAIAIILGLLVLVFGSTTRGTTGWIKFVGLGFQPVELMKIFLIFFLARYFSNSLKDIFSWKRLLISGIFSFFLIGLILLQPDLGSAMILVAVWLGLLLLSGVKKSQILILMLAGVVVFVSAWFGLLHDYQKARLLTFVNPTQDVLGSGYNVRQAIISLGSGEIFGRGLTRSFQSQLNFLPEAHTDFIWATLGESFGFVGMLVILILFVAIFYKMLHYLVVNNSIFENLTIAGIVIMFFVQMAINIGMNVGLLPVTGVPLPLVSFGGSHIIVDCLALGVAHRIMRQKSRVQTI